MSRTLATSHRTILTSMILMVGWLFLLQACGGGGGGGGGGAPPPNSPWTWISGSNIANQAGNYGTQGVAASTNVPGARTGAATWIDSSNTLWLMGGSGMDRTGAAGNLNDLWKFTSATGWTWVSGSNTINQSGVYGSIGVAAATNVPGARNGSVSWIDSSDTLWLMGGVGYDTGTTPGRLSDLWKFNPVTGFWTWVSGSNTSNQAGVYGSIGVAAATNVPGARNVAAAWIDSSNTLWLMGGLGHDDAGTLGRLNDLWKFDPITGFWVWVSGSNFVAQAGTYGTKGIADAANVPGARSSAAAWIDSSNTLWLMGGVGYDTGTTLGRLNDLWKFNPVTGFWTWVSGSNTINLAGVYGTMGSAAATNVPGARFVAATWIDSSNTLWLMGGSGHDVAGTLDRLNDLWKFDPITGFWTWVYGSNTVNQSGSYGTQGVIGPSHVPGARQFLASWIDSSNTLWLFGGTGYDSAGTLGGLNDLWRYTP